MLAMKAKGPVKAMKAMKAMKAADIWPSSPSGWGVTPLVSPPFDLGGLACGDVPHTPFLQGALASGRRSTPIMTT